ncbi:DNA repair protein RadA, partial [Desulforudis sp. 1190]
RPVAPRTVVVGEVGLTGEVRPIGALEKRLNEARKLGFNRAIVPDGGLASDNSRLELCKVRTVSEALDQGL